jgi:hypothetical protein
MQDNIDMLFSKLESHEAMQHQIVTQLDITTQALAQSSKDHSELMQQIAAMRELVVKLAAGRRPGDPPEVRGVVHQEHHQDPLGTQQQHCAFGGRQQLDNEVQAHRTTLPKLSFSKFSRDNPRIWLDKYVDYFRIFNILIVHVGYRSFSSHGRQCSEIAADVQNQGGID